VSPRPRARRWRPGSARRSSPRPGPDRAIIVSQRCLPGLADDDVRQSPSSLPRRHFRGCSCFSGCCRWIEVKVPSPCGLIRDRCPAGGESAPK
jgi:hypothetical protein